MNILSFIQKASWAVLPALLLLFSQWLAETMSSKDVSLWYSTEHRSVAGLYSVYLKFSNYSDVAIDKVQVKSLPQDAIQKSYSPKNATNTNSEWEGEIVSGNSLEILYVLNKELAISATTINDLVEAEYRKRNTNTGSLEWVTVPLAKEGVIVFSSAVVYLFWFFLPIFLSLLAVFLFYKLSTRFRVKSP